MTRLLIASNRLPVTVESESETLTLAPSTGGLATGLGGICDSREVAWIGWPGIAVDTERQSFPELERELASRHLLPVHLTQDEVTGYYRSMANGVLWPVFHDQINHLSPELHGWDEFVSVNEKFTRAIEAHHQTGDLIWIHDYHLCLVPKMLRQRLPGAAIGFFLHIPFPSSEIFSVLPWRNQILEGLLGADLIGFHTVDYLHNFAAALHRLFGSKLHNDRIVHGAHETILGVFPMGIDAAGWQARAEDADVIREAEGLRRDSGGRTLLLGIDRLDYTKGILRRCLAVERLLSMDERLSDGLRYIQVTVPSRQGVDAYANLERNVDETVGRINAAYASTSAVPIHRIHRSLSERELSVLYRATDVMLVTPLRDGMNLVAKEFIASRRDEDGVLVLSEFAGAASELREALHVNPYDIEGTASVILRALTMPRDERCDRMRRLRARVSEQDVHRWVNSFVGQLEAISSGVQKTSVTTFSPVQEIVAHLRNTESLALDQIAAAIPATFIEEKTAGYAWHFRKARGRDGSEDAAKFDKEARNVFRLLNDLLANSPAEAISADGVIEVRPRANHKGTIVADCLATTGRPRIGAAIGDDGPDEDLFRALPEGSVTVKVGAGRSLARYRVQSVLEVRQLLCALLE